MVTASVVEGGKCFSALSSPLLQSGGVVCFLVEDMKLQSDVGQGDCMLESGCLR